MILVYYIEHRRSLPGPYQFPGDKEAFDRIVGAKSVGREVEKLKALGKLPKEKWIDTSELDVEWVYVKSSSIARVAFVDD